MTLIGTKAKKSSSNNQGTEQVDLITEKNLARAKARVMRTHTADNNQDADSVMEPASAIARNLLGIPKLWDALEASGNEAQKFPPPVFASYAPAKNEINPNAFLDALKRMELERPLMAFPRVVGKGTLSMHFALLEELAPGSYGIPEPKDSARLVLPEDIDVILVPGLAFDCQGNRLGYGKGYYDQYLPQLSEKALTIGVSYDECLYDNIPAEAHDVRMDYIVTPERVVTI